MTQFAGISLRYEGIITKATESTDAAYAVVEKGGNCKVYALEYVGLSGIIVGNVAASSR